MNLLFRLKLFKSMEQLPEGCISEDTMAKYILIWLLMTQAYLMPGNYIYLFYIPETFNTNTTRTHKFKTPVS